MADDFDFDVVIQLKEVMGDGYGELVSVYEREAAIHIGSIRESVFCGDVGVIANCAHSVKSSSGNMGLVRLSRCAAELERKAEKAKASGGAIEGLDFLVGSIEVEFQKGKEILSRQV